MKLVVQRVKHAEVKVDGKKWSAISSEPISKGKIVEIKKIDGVKLIVKEKKEC